MPSDEVPVPDGVFPFFVSNQAAESYGLKNGPAIVDLIRRKTFNTSEILSEIQRLGFMCAFEPCEQELKRCGLDEFVVVCDSTSKYGEMFLLLYSQDSIETFKSDAEIQDLVKEEAAQKAKKEADEREAAIAARKKAVYVEKPFYPREYVSTTSGKTSREVDALAINQRRELLSFTISRPVSMINRSLKLEDKSQDQSGYLDFRPQKVPEFDLVSKLKDNAVQAAPATIDKTSQTKWKRNVNKCIQYESLTHVDFGYSDKEVWENIGTFLENTVGIVECALQENETVDIYADYLEIAHREECIDILPESDTIFKEICNFTDLEYNKGKDLTCIDWHPTRTDIIAASACQRISFEDAQVMSCKPVASYISIWYLGNQIHPILVLGGPLDCPIFRFNPSSPDIVVAGCINGQILMWKISDLEECIASSTTSKRDDRLEAACSKYLVKPVAMSHPEFSHKRMVSDMLWMPPHLQVSR